MMNKIIIACKIVFALKQYKIIALISFFIFLILYLFALPSSYTGGLISIESLSYLDGQSVFLSLLMAALAALIMAFIIYLFKQGQSANKASATGGLVLGFITPLLCCSPLLPIAFGLIASLFPTLNGSFLGPQVQGFIATHQEALFTLAIMLLILALYQNAKRITDGVGCRTPTTMNIKNLGN